VLLLGLGLERASLALFHFAEERLPGKPRAFTAVLVCSAPALLVCALGEVLIAERIASFNEVMSLGGVFSNALVSGVVPMLLVLASRRRGDRTPSATIGPLGGPAVVAVTTALYAALLVAMATVLFDDAVYRVAAGAAAVVLAYVVWESIRGGAFRPRASEAGR
jgi:hypothetical protein